MPKAHTDAQNANSSCKSKTFTVNPWYNELIGRKIRKNSKKSKKRIFNSDLHFFSSTLLFPPGIVEEESRKSRRTKYVQVSFNLYCWNLSFRFLERYDLLLVFLPPEIVKVRAMQNFYTILID
ncbi:hypothetical protein BpHYR1_044660 [Brachionus plicatilis]|uniref:Uncharacterized protein n=1 Tax=Brachionus plicatilis TaxID=10195 RepID=A0A3M7PUE0_BRAPC|nr:hypothetical protein BpHYR1_044660 [Brachionus plicatilis]